MLSAKVIIKQGFSRSSVGVIVQNFYLNIKFEFYTKCHFLKSQKHIRGPFLRPTETYTEISDTCLKRQSH
jgi:hypothetical protein